MPTETPDLVSEFEDQKQSAPDLVSEFEQQKTAQQRPDFTQEALSGKLAPAAGKPQEPSDGYFTNPRTGIRSKMSAVPEADMVPMVDPARLTTTGPEQIVGGGSDIIDAEKQTRQEPGTFYRNPRTGIKSPVYSLPEDARRKEVAGAADVLSGVGDVSMPLVGASALSAPVKTAAGFAAGAALSAGAGKAVHGKVSPEDESLIRAVAQFIPSAAAVASGLEVTAGRTPEGGYAAGAKAFGGKFGAAVRSTPEAFEGAVKAGDTRIGASIPRNGAQAPAATQPPALDEATAAMVRYEQNAGNIPKPPPPVPPPTPGQQFGNKLSGDQVDHLAQTIAKAPPESQNALIEEAHTNLTKWILENNGHVYIGGKVILAKSPDQVEALSAKIINDASSAHDKAQDLAAKEAEKAAKEQGKQTTAKTARPSAPSPAPKPAAAPAKVEAQPKAEAPQSQPAAEKPVVQKVEEKPQTSQNPTANEGAKQEVKPVHDFASTQVNIDPKSELGQQHAQAVAAMPEDHIGPNGKEDTPHVTVRYGLKDDSPEAIAKIKEAASKVAPFEATVGKTSSFPATKEGDRPIIAHVEKSPELNALRSAVEGAGDFKENTHGEYKPHVTLGYVKPEHVAKYEGGNHLEGGKVPVDHVTVTKRDGTSETIKLGGKPVPDLVSEHEAAPDLVAEHEAQPERRTSEDRKPENAALRAKFDKMTPEERSKALVEYHERERTSEKTGLPNLKAFEEDAATMAESHPHVGYADVDDFKQYNNALGHQGVDQAVLPAIGKLFADAANKEPNGSVKVYHRSGDEFNFRSKTPEAIKRVVGRVNQELAATTFKYQTKDGKIVEKKGTGLKHGIGSDHESAEANSEIDSKLRTENGQRSGARDVPAVDSPGTGGKQAPVGDDTGRNGVSGKITREGIPLSDKEQSEYSQQKCHALTAAMMQFAPAGEPLVVASASDPSSIAHSAFRIPHTDTVVDSSGAYKGVEAFRQSAAQRFNLGEDATVRTATESEIHKMVPGVPKARAIGQAASPAKRLLAWGDSVAGRNGVQGGSGESGTKEVAPTDTASEKKRIYAEIQTLNKERNSIGFKIDADRINPSAETKALVERHTELSRKIHALDDEVAKLDGQPTRAEKSAIAKKEAEKPFGERPKEALKYGDVGQSQPWQVLEKDFIAKRFESQAESYKRAIADKEKEVAALKPGTAKRISEESSLKFWKERLVKLKAGDDPRIAQEFRNAYIKTVKDAISHGKPVPQSVIDQHPEFTKAQTSRETYEKGRHTSFSNRSVAINDTMQKELGFKAKRQDGKPITDAQIKEIHNSVKDVESVIGSLADIMRGVDLTIAHTNGKFPFLMSDAAGLFSETDKRITVGLESMFSAKPIPVFAHEIAHMIDIKGGNLLGETTRVFSKGGKGYESSSLAEAEAKSYKSDLIREATGTINKMREVRALLKAKKTEDLTPEEKLEIESAKVKLGPYWRDPREVFARLFEQYIANKLGKVSDAAQSPQTYAKQPGYWTQDQFEKFIPKIESEINRRLDALHAKYGKPGTEGPRAGNGVTPAQTEEPVKQPKMTEAEVDAMVAKDYAEANDTGKVRSRIYNTILASAEKKFSKGEITKKQLDDIREKYGPVRDSSTTQKINRSVKGKPSERGFAHLDIPSVLAHGVADPVTSFVKDTIKQTAESRSVDDKLFGLSKQYEADVLRAIELMKQVGPLSTPEDQAAIYHHLEDSSVPLDSKQQAVLDKIVKPLMQQSSAIRSELNTAGVPMGEEGYVHRVVQGKSSQLERAMRGKQGTGKGNVLSRSAASLKQRKMFALEDEDGNRQVVAMEGGRITGFKNGAPEDLGASPRLKVGDNFNDKTAKPWTLQQATTKEIEAATSLKYYKNALASAVTDYLQLLRAKRANDALESMKSDPGFNQMAFKSEKGSMPPEGWRSVDLPQFRDYYFEPHMAEVLNRFAKELHPDPVTFLEKVGNFMTASLLLNPIRHVYNIGNHWLVERGVSGTFNPLTWPTAAKAGMKAIKAVVNQNEDFLSALDHGAPMMSHRTDLQQLHHELFQTIVGHLEKNPSIANKIAELVGYDKAGPEDTGVVNAVARGTGLRMLNNVRKLGQKAMWMSNDMMMLQSAYEKMAGNPSLTFEDAMAQTEKHIPNYRIPTRILNSKAMGDFMGSRLASMFGRYHYGVWRSYGEMLKESLGPDSTPKERLKGLDHMIMLGMITFLMYKLVDEVLKKITGDHDARMVRSGASAAPNSIKEIIQGHEDPSQLLRNTFTPAILPQATAEAMFNRDFFSGAPVRNPKHSAGKQVIDVSKHFMNALGPVQQYNHATRNSHPAKSFLLSQVGVSTSHPKKHR